jgi:hypothetical protein
MDDNPLNPTYIQGLTARNRLTDARDAVYRLIETLPVSRQRAAARIYQDLCSIQGRLENLLDDVPIHPNGQGETHAQEQIEA